MKARFNPQSHTQTHIHIQTHTKMATETDPLVSNQEAYLLPVLSLV